MRCKLPRIDWLNLDYGRLGKHLAGAFLLTVGGAGAAGKPVWPAVTAWFWGALIYTGGAIQNYGKDEEPDGHLESAKSAGQKDAGAPQPGEK